MQIGDKHAMGAIVVKFDITPDNWLKDYMAFIHWIKNHVTNKSVLVG
jgi:hypothetical protein